MSDYYYIVLRNGDLIKINQERRDKLAAALLSDDIQKFVDIDGHLIRTDFIVNIKKELW